MIISHKHKFIFIKTRKTAGSSLEDSLLSYLGDDDIVAGLDGLPKVHANSYDTYDKHIKWDWIADNYSEEWNRYFKFTVDRNPWDKVVSFYYWYAFRKPRKVKRGFAHFVMSLHLRKCSDWQHYTNTSNQVVVDQILPYERLHESLVSQSRIPYNGEMLTTCLKGTHRPKLHYSQFYTKELKQEVARFFSNEIKYFDYQFLPGSE